MKNLTIKTKEIEVDILVDFNRRVDQVLTLVNIKLNPKQQYINLNNKNIISVETSLTENGFLENDILYIEEGQYD